MTPHLHTVVGAPYRPGGVPQNSFRIEHVGINPDTQLPEDIVDGETDQFTVTGKLPGRSRRTPRRSASAPCGRSAPPGRRP